MEAEGKVICNLDRTAVVEIRRKGACGDNCAHCAGCSAQLMQIEADCPIAVSAGDWVKISSDQKAIFSGLFILFFMPLALPLAVYFLSAGSGLEIWLTLSAIVMSIVLIWLLNKSKRFQDASRPKVIEVIIKTRSKDE